VQEVLQKLLKDYVIQQCRYRGFTGSAAAVVTEQMTSKQALQVYTVPAALLRSV